MMEFAVFFIVPFPEDMPKGETEAAIEKAKAIKMELESKCLKAYEALAPKTDKPRKLDRQVWAQSTIDFDVRIIGVSLRLPIEKGAEKDVVAVVKNDDFLYWDFDELVAEMLAMKNAMAEIAVQYKTKPHVAYSDVRYHY